MSVPGKILLAIVWLCYLFFCILQQQIFCFFILGLFKSCYSLKFLLPCSCHKIFMKHHLLCIHIFVYCLPADKIIDCFMFRHVFTTAFKQCYFRKLWQIFQTSGFFIHKTNFVVGYQCFSFCQITSFFNSYYNDYLFLFVSLRTILKIHTCTFSCMPLCVLVLNNCMTYFVCIKWQSINGCALILQ